MRSAVDLPQPEEPTRTANSWSRISIERSSTAFTFPYCFTTFLRVTLAISFPRYLTSASLAGQSARLQARCGAVQAGEFLAVGQHLLDVLAGAVDQHDDGLLGLGRVARYHSVQHGPVQRQGSARAVLAG